MVGNATFDHGTLRALRAKVDGVQHPAGSTFTQHGDLNQHGHTTAADCRNTNTRLRGAEGEMTEEEMVSEAIARSLREPLQVYLISARQHQASCHGTKSHRNIQHRRHHTHHLFRIQIP